MSGRHGGDGYTSVPDVRDHGRRCALAGKPIYVNPFLGSDAEEWFAAYREVPEEERGSQPDLARPRKRLHGPKRPAWFRQNAMSGAGVKALGDKCLKGSTPRPWTEPVS